MVHSIETRSNVTTGPWCADQEKRHQKSLLSYTQIVRTVRSSFKSVSTRTRRLVVTSVFGEITCYDIPRGFARTAIKRVIRLSVERTTVYDSQKL